MNDAARRAVRAVAQAVHGQAHRLGVGHVVVAELVGVAVGREDAAERLVPVLVAVRALRRRQPEMRLRREVDVVADAIALHLEGDPQAGLRQAVRVLHVDAVDDVLLEGQPRVLVGDGDDQRRVGVHLDAPRPEGREVRDEHAAGADRHVPAERAVVRRERHDARPAPAAKRGRIGVGDVHLHRAGVREGLVDRRPSPESLGRSITIFFSCQLRISARGCVGGRAGRGGRDKRGPPDQASARRSRAFWFSQERTAKHAMRTMRFCCWRSTHSRHDCR